MTSSTELPHGTRSRRATYLWLRAVLLSAAFYFLILPQIPGFRQAATDLRNVQPEFLLVGFVLVLASIVCYSALTKATLGDAGRHISHWRMFRIQMATRALANVVPGGSAAGSALGFRLLTLSGAPGPDAGFALATAAFGSAMVLNLLFWIGLLISIPIRGVNPLYAAGATAGVLVSVLVAVLVIGLIDGHGRSERAVRWLAQRLRLDPDRWARVLRQLGRRVEGLINDRNLLRRVVAWSAAQWAFDMAALWVFVHAFGPSLDLDALVVAFGLANILAAIPITPGGLGIVEGTYIATFVGFGLSRRSATLGVATYRLAQYFFPILLGALLYLSLRVGPWSIKRDERLLSLSELAEQHTADRRAATRQRSDRRPD